MFYIGFVVGMICVFGLEFGLMSWQKHKVKKQLKNVSNN